MFKRLLSAISGKNASEPTPATNTHTTEPSQDEQPIVAYDAYGREMQIPRSEWREKVFLPSLEQKRDNADELYQSIVDGLNDGFAADLVQAAERLLEIDPLPERSHTIHGIVLMDNGQLTAAENTLQAGIAKAGRPVRCSPIWRKSFLRAVKKRVQTKHYGRLCRPIRIRKMA